jgi:two-component system NtrC family response regulator
MDAPPFSDEGVSLESLEVDLIQKALEQTNGNRSQAAKLLGLTRYALLYRMRKHGFRV